MCVYFFKNWSIVDSVFQLYSKEFQFYLQRLPSQQSTIQSTSHMTETYALQSPPCPLLSRVWLFVAPWTAARQDSLSITNSWSLLKLMSIELVMPSNHLILCPPFFSCLQSFSASASFPMSQFFASGGQSIGAWASASASALTMNIQGWFPLWLTDLISLQSKGLSRVFSNTTVQKHQFFGTQPSSWSTLTPIHDHWKNHSLD